MLWSIWKGRMSKQLRVGGSIHSCLPRGPQTICRKVSSTSSGAVGQRHMGLGLHQVEEVTDAQVVLHFGPLGFCQFPLAIPVREFRSCD